MSDRHQRPGCFKLFWPLQRYCWWGCVAYPTIRGTGLESFAEKTVLSFDKGLSGVVGPNGMGSPMWSMRSNGV